MATAIYARPSLEDKDVDALARASLVYSGQYASVHKIYLFEVSIWLATRSFIKNSESKAW